MKIITTKAQLIESLKDTKKNDIVVIDLQYAMDLSNDLYSFYIDVIPGIKLMNGETVNEIRFCPIPNK